MEFCNDFKAKTSGGPHQVQVSDDLTAKHGPSTNEAASSHRPVEASSTPAERPGRTLRSAMAAATSALNQPALTEAPRGSPPPPSLCEVCAAPLAEAAAASEAARRTAAALLGPHCAVASLCRPCAGLVQLIHRRRLRLEQAQRRLRDKYRGGLLRRQTASEANGVKKEELPRDSPIVGKVDPCSNGQQSEEELNHSEEKETGDEQTPAAAANASDSEPAPAGQSVRRPRAAAAKQCDTCGKQFSTWRSLDSHRNVHTGARPYACAHCERRFPSKAALRQHSGMHFNKWACDICQKVYSTEPALSTHRSYVHFPERLKTVTCGVCGKQFLGQKRFNKHMQTHAAEGDRFRCPVEGCGSSFKTRNALNVHACKHQGKRFACDQCPALFFSKASMQQHMVRHGSVEAKFQCPLCQRRFIYNSILKCHMASAHNSERDRVCEVCGATFTCNSALNAHKLAHQEERPHACPSCPATFKRKQVLSRHVRFVHNHEVTVRCEHCDKGFQTLYKLKIHLRTHTGERPYGCSFCAKRFTQRSHVRSHMQMHVGVAAEPARAPVAVEAAPLSAAPLSAALAAGGALPLAGTDVVLMLPTAAGAQPLPGQPAGPQHMAAPPAGPQQVPVQQLPGQPCGPQEISVQPVGPQQLPAQGTAGQGVPAQPPR